MDEKDVVNEELKVEAIKAAVASDVAVIFAGLPESFESEGYDRTHMRLPNCQNDLINGYVRCSRIQLLYCIMVHR